MLNKQNRCTSFISNQQLKYIKSICRYLCPASIFGNFPINTFPLSSAHFNRYETWKTLTASQPEYNGQHKSPGNSYNNRLFKIHTMKCLKVFTSTKCGYGKKTLLSKKRKHRQALGLLQLSRSYSVGYKYTARSVQ